MSRGAYLFLLSLIGIRPVSSAGKPVELRLDGWSAIMEPETLTVRARVAGSPDEILAAGGGRSAIESLMRAGQSVTWKMRESAVAVEFTVRGNRLHARFEASHEQTFEWLRTKHVLAFLNRRLM